ncbi:ATP-binding protein [Cellulosilyticum ruminicola]|uniref:ATP-binding protein n=1 Tax=Cellulosilyticum ruminicola TaxID=425254 RepID=UPI0006D20DAF|nr:ATP-binding protein [Cellulosilyticum ruminicola]
MNTLKELNWNELKTSYQPSDFSFSTILEQGGSEGIIGQESANRALELGMLIEAEGYNVYIVGESNKERDLAIKHLIQQKAQTKQTPQDICYIYNFKNPEIPQCIELEAGDGKVLEADMTEFMQSILIELPLLLQSKEVSQKKQDILDELDKVKEQLITDLSEKAESMDIVVKNTGGTIGFAPLNEEGEIYSKEEYNALTKIQKKQVEEKLEILYEYADHITERIEEEEKKYAVYLRDIEEEVVLDYVGGMIKVLKEKYNGYKFLRKYFNDIAEDILVHLELFEEHNEEENKLKDIFPWANSNQLQKMVNKYNVNLLVAHKEGSGAPIIEDSMLGEICLNGKILLDSEINNMHTDFMHIRPGLFHKANGGYLILHMQKILENPTSWLAIKQLLKTGYIHMRDSEDMGIALANSMKPQPVKSNIKVILMGSRSVYEVLSTNDEDFKNLFKIKVIYENEINNTKDHIEAIASCIAKRCKVEELPDVTVGGLLKVVEYGVRKVGSTKKLPANMDDYMDVIREASIYNSKLIDEEAIQKAICRRKSFLSKIRA